MAFPVDLGANFLGSSGHSGPLRCPDSYEESFGNFGSNFNFGRVATNNVKIAQSITTNSAYDTGGVVVGGQVVGTPTDNIVITIEADSSGEPSGTPLATATIPLLEVPANGTTNPWMFAQFASDLSLSNATVYWIVFDRSSTASDTNYFQAKGWNSGGYTGGNDAAFNGTTWTGGTADLSFYLMKRGEESYVLALGVDDASDDKLVTYRATAPDTSWTSTSSVAVYFGISGGGILSFRQDRSDSDRATLVGSYAEVTSGVYSFAFAHVALFNGFILGDFESPVSGDAPVGTAPGATDHSTRTTGEVVVLYEGDPDKFMGVDRSRIDAAVRDPSDGSWVTGIAINTPTGTGTAANFKNVAIADGSDEWHHFFYNEDDGNAHFASLNPADDLTDGDTEFTSLTFPLRWLRGAISYDDAGTQRVRVMVFNASGVIITHTFNENASTHVLESRVASNSNLDQPTANGSGMDYVIDPATDIAYGLSEHTDGDLFVEECAAPHATADWDGTPIEIENAVAINTIQANVYTRAGATVIGIAYTEDADTSVYYTEYEISAAGPTVLFHKNQFINQAVNRAGTY